MRWLVYLAICGQGFRRKEDPVSPQSLHEGKSDGAVRLLQSKRSHHRGVGESSSLYPNVVLSSKGPWYSPSIKSAFEASNKNLTCGPNASVVFLGTAPLYDANGSLAAGLESMQRQINTTKRFLNSTFGSGNYTLYSWWHTGAGLFHYVDGGPIHGSAASPDEVKGKLQTACMIYVDGGNTYALQYFLARDAEVTEALKARVRAGAIYVGASAGAIVTGKTAETANFKNWRGEGDSLVDWQSVAGADSLRWSADSLSVVGLGLQDHGRLRNELVCNSTSFSTSGNATSGNASSCLDLNGLEMVPIGIFPHLKTTNALDFAVGAFLSAETQPVVALPNDVALVPFAANSGTGIRLFVPNCSAKILVSTPLSATFAAPEWVPSAANATVTVPAVAFAGVTWAVESPECPVGMSTVEVCECFPTWPARAEAEEQLPPCMSCAATTARGHHTTLTFEAVRDAVDTTKLRFDDPGSTGEHRLLVLRLEPMSFGSVPGLAGVALLALLLGQ